MFNTGRRTIFDVCQEHIGHSIEILPIEQEGVVMGIRVYCRTCSETLIQQETTCWETAEAITQRKVERLRGLGYEVKGFEAWQREFIERCYQEDGETPRYEGSEWDEVYNDYLDTFTPQPQQQSNGWDTQGWNT